ncbi:MAG: hypothetical protein U0L97_05035 [Candidatus Saccharimonadaceae bacterium]|nr:hypothetical protein [Candidatus Saccharimonadaceae bacterium]
MKRNKHFANPAEEFLFEWEFVFPDGTSLAVCKDFFGTFLASLTVRNPRFAGVLVNYPVAISGRVYNTDRFEEGETINTDYIKSIRRVHMTLFDRIALWAWWPNLTRVKYLVTTEDGDVYTIWLRDASAVTLEVLDACVYDEFDDAGLVLAPQ